MKKVRYFPMHFNRVPSYVFDVICGNARPVLAILSPIRYEYLVLYVATVFYGLALLDP